MIIVSESSVAPELDDAYLRLSSAISSSSLRSEASAGFEILDDGSVQAELKYGEPRRGAAVQQRVFLMFILIWIQTGFAMVILSAAIKAVPEELFEAARLDGATESQQFFNVTLPQILPTVGVVLTTILVAVAKVFDIVRVSTGNW